MRLRATTIDGPSPLPYIFRQLLLEPHTRWVKCDFIPAAYLKKHWKDHFTQAIKQCWQQQSLENLPPHLTYLFDPDYQNKIITKLMDVTWFVYVGEKLSNAQFTVRYIGRYTKRPAIAESRITAYDGKTVTFNFVDHKTEKLTFHTQNRHPMAATPIKSACKAIIAISLR